MSTEKCPCCGTPWSDDANVELLGVTSDGHLDLVLTCEDEDCGARFNCFVLVRDFTENQLPGASA